MKIKIALIVLCLLTLVGCEAIQALDKNVLAEAMTSALSPLLAKLDGMTPEKLAAITAALKGAVLSAIPDTESGFDWQTLLSHTVTAAAAYFGVNLRRDFLRTKRGEKV